MSGDTRACGHSVARHSRGGVYGITVDEFDAMLAAQRGRCAICSSPEPRSNCWWHIDHDHDTGHVRGLLCGPCNQGIGSLGDDPDRLRLAIAYLEDRKHG
jgi:hypothetical protein